MHMTIDILYMYSYAFDTVADAVETNTPRPNCGDGEKGTNGFFM
jgi:hypothetical protein